MKLITTTQELDSACKKLAANHFLTIDTEFMRESTFWPKLCLIQMAGPNEEFIVDPLADGIDLQPFFDLMNDADVLKVFHAARQDIEIVYHLAGIVPHPIFDTQVAAMVCGFGESVSYSMLVKKLLKQNLDKTSRFTDWSRRPLSEKQTSYALFDVTYLRDIYPLLKDKLDASGRAPWLDEEMAILTNPDTYDLHPENAWRRLKMRVKTAKALAIMMELAAWRETEAQEQDVPRSRIIKDDAIYDIANQAPRSVGELGALRTVNEGFAKSKRGKNLLAAVERGIMRNPQTVPSLKKGHPLPPEAAAVVDLLRVLLKWAAAHHGVATKLIATSDDLDKLAVNDKAEIPALRGWRRKLFGQDAIDLKHGRLALSVKNGEIQVTGHKTGSQDDRKSVMIEESS